MMAEKAAAVPINEIASKGTAVETPLIGLFTPLDLAGLCLRNRMVMAPMTRQRAAGDGTPTPLMTRAC